MPGPHHNPSPIRDYLAVVVITAVVMLVPLTPACSKRLDVEAVHPAREESVPEVWATDGEAPDAGPIARPMPEKAFKGQKTPPCGREQVAIAGGCWEVLKRKPVNGSCGPSAFEHEGECHIPVHQAKRPPTSVAP